MKKYVAILLAVLLLLNVTAICALADPAEGENPPVSDDTPAGDTSTEGDTDDTTTSGDTTTSTEDTTGTTGTTQTAFEVTDTIVTYTESSVDVSYTATNNAVPSALLIAGKTYLPDSSEPGKLSIAINKLPFGSHSVTLVFAEGAVVAGEYKRGGHVNTLMQLESDGADIRAIVYDTEFKLPVVGAELTITVDGREYPAQKTNSDGRITFSGVLPTGKTVSVKCVLATQTIDTVTYNGQTGTKKFTYTPDANDSDTSTTTTTGVTLPTGDGDTAVTYPTLEGALTTSAAADGVAADFIIDSALLTKFGVSDVNAFAGKAKVVIPTARYDQLSQLHKAAIYGRLATLNTTVESDKIAEAINGHMTLKRANVETAVVLPFTFTLQAVGVRTDENIDADFTNTEYVVTLPIPASMSTAEVFAVALAGANGLYDLQSLTAENGCITFKANSLDHYVLIGFDYVRGMTAVEEEEESNPLTGLVVVLYVVGVLLILGAVALIVWPFVRDRFFPVVEEDDSVLIYGAEPEEEEPADDLPPVFIPPVVDDFPGVPPIDGDPASDVTLGDFDE